jgi:hypothetical protein
MLRWCGVEEKLEREVSENDRCLYWISTALALVLKMPAAALGMMRSV